MINFLIFLINQYLLREWDSVEFNKDRSLSRCGLDSIPFRPDLFALTIPTPSQPNNCISAVFIIEMAMDVITNPLSSVVQNKIEGCSSFFEPNIHESVSTSQVESYLRNRENRAATGDCEETGTNMANLDHSIWMAINKERRMGRY